MFDARPERVYLATGFAQGLFWSAWWVGAIGLWMVDLALSPLQLVVLGTALEGAVMLSESPTGAVADTFSRKWSIVLSWVIVGVASIGSALSTSIVALLAWQAAWGFGYTFQTGADTAWVTDELGREDDRLIMFHAVAGTVGAIVGIGAAVGSLAWLEVSVRAVMTVAGAGSLAVAAAAAAAISERNFSPVERAGRSSVAAVADTWKRGLRVVRASAVLRVILIMVVLVAMADEAIDRLDVLRMIELGLPAADGSEAAVWAGGLWMAMTVLRLPVIWWTARAAEASGVTDVTDAAGVTHATDATDITEAAGVTDITDAADATDITDATDFADVTDITDAADATDITDATDFADVTEAVEEHSDPSDSPVTYAAEGPGSSSGSVAPKRRASRTVVALLTLSTLGVSTMIGGWFWLAVVGWAVRDITREVLEPVVTAWVNRHAETEVRATVISFRSQAMAAGQIVGGLVLASLAEATSLRTAFVGAAALLALAALTIARGPTRRPR